MASSGSYSAFNSVDDLVSKPVLGSDGAASWQEFRKEELKASSKSGGTAPNLPVKRSHQLGTGLKSIEEEREHERKVREEGGNSELGAGYTTFKRKHDPSEIAEKKRRKLIEERIRPDDVPYYIKSDAFDGHKEDYVFTTKAKRTGYYWDGWDSAKRLLEGDDGGGGGESRDGIAGLRPGIATADGGTAKKKKKKKKNPTFSQMVDDDSNNPMEQVAAALRRRNQSIANPPATLLAGSGWETATDPASGKVYHFNRSTGERRWASDGQATSRASLQVAGNVKSKPLPSGWESGKDSRTGKVYYFHRATNRTSWDQPTE